MTIRRDILNIPILILLHLISIVPFLNCLGLMLQFFLFFYYYIKKDYVNFVVLLALFSLYGKSLSIYSLKMIYGLILLLFLIDFKMFSRIKFSKHNAFFCAIFITFFIVYSLIKNCWTQSSSFISDFIILIGILVGLLLFNKMNFSNLLKVSLRLLVLFLVTGVFRIITGFGYSSEVDWWGRPKNILSFGESCSMFYFVLLYPLFFSGRSLFIKFFLIFLYLFISIILQNVGSMILIFFCFCILFLTLLKFFQSKKKGFILFVIALIFPMWFSVVGIIENSHLADEFQAITFKLENITKLVKNFSLTDRKKISLIPLSPYVRVLEAINITHSSNVYTFLFGHGLGGFYTDNYFHFENRSAGKILGPNDFPIEQRRSHVFTSSHNLSYPFLKYGILYFAFLFLYIFFSLRNFKQRLRKRGGYISDLYCLGIYLGFVLFLVASTYLGFTFQTSLMISLMLCAFNNYIRQSFCGNQGDKKMTETLFLSELSSIKGGLQ